MELAWVVWALLAGLVVVWVAWEYARRWLG